MGEPSREEFYDRAPVGYVTLRLDGTVVQANETFLTWTGYGRDLLLGGTDFTTLLTVGGQVFFETHCLPLLLGGRPVEQASLDVRRADGTTMPVLFAATLPRGESGADDALIRVSVVDLSQRRLFEEQLVSRNDALSLSNDELDTFARAAAHDLQAPLRGIAQNTEFFLEDTAGQLPPEAEDLLHTVVRLAGRMRDMLDDLLAYAQAGRAAWNPATFALSTAIHEVVEMLGSRAERANVHVADAEITVDPGVFRQLMLNIVGNAVKYSAAPAQIEIGVCRLEEAPARPPGSPVLSPSRVHAPVVTVTDQGAGIDPRFHDAVFELYRQLDPHTDGTGAGLALCRAACRSQGGDVWLTSEPGVGTTFYVLCAVAP